jgi:hypothetical protein
MLMRKLMVMVAMLVFMLAVAAPAFAQDVSVTTGNDTEFNAVCQNLVGSVGDVTATQTSVAAAGNLSDMDDSAAVGVVDQSQNVSFDQSSVCLNDFNGDGFLGFFEWLWWWF